jgi:threonine/homoserine/homoserine lactone efflux protein
MLEFFSPYIASILTIASLHFILVVMPGGDFAMTVRNSLLYSRTCGFMVACGISCGMFMHATYTILGIGLLIKSIPWLFYLLRFAGASYLCYVGVSSIVKKSDMKSMVSQKGRHDPQHNIWESFRNGFISNALNPMVILGLLGILGDHLEPTTPKAILAFYGFEIVIIPFLWFSFVAFCFSNSSIRNAFMRLGHTLDVIMGSALVGFAFKSYYEIVKDLI